MFRLLPSLLLSLSVAIILSVSGCSDRSTDAPTTVTLSGSIVDARTQRPIANALVAIINATSGTELANAMTDANGSFRFDNLPRVRMYALVDAYGYTTQNQTLFDPDKSSQPQSSISIPLSSVPCCTGVLTLTVKDNANNPVADATVKLWKKSILIKTTKTGSSGAVVIDSLCAGEFGVSVKKDGYEVKEFTFGINENCDPVTKSVVLEPPPCCTGVFSLTVTNASNAPIASATVKLWKGSILIKTTQTDSQGQVAIDSLCSGEYHATAYATGYIAKEASFVINANCDPVSKTLALEASPCCNGVISITVNDQSSAPIQGALVKIWNKNGIIVFQDLTDATGKAVFDSLCAGEYNYFVTKDTYTKREGSFVINNNCDPVSKTVTMEKLPCCSGVYTLTVVDSSNVPIVGATVKLMKGGVYLKAATTGSDGKAVFADLCAGEYVARALKDGIGDKQISFVINTSCDPVSQTLILGKQQCCSGLLTLTVTDKNNAAIAGATVKLFKGGQLLKTKTTDASGVVTFGDLCPAEYGVDVTKDGFTHKEFAFTINANCDPVTKTVALESNSSCCSGKFTMLVTDVSNAPLAGINVKVLKNGVIIAAKVTDADGKIVVDSLCAGEYVAKVFKDGYITKEVAFTINANCDPVTKTVVLEASPCCTGKLLLTVLNGSSAPISGATVKLMSGGKVLKTESTNSEGKLTFTSLCKGTYAVLVMKDGYQAQDFTFEINANCDPVTKTVTLVP